MAVVELRGAVLEWGLGGRVRAHMVVSLPYGQARAVFRPDLYSAATGRGEQRGVIANHARALRKAMEAGTYTPTPVSVGLRPQHADALYYEGGQAVLLADGDDPLPLTDGGHRFEALELIRAGSDEAALAVDTQPVTALVYLDGDPRDDFLNLQMGRPVDKSHILSLRLHGRDGEGSGDGALAFAVARLLHDDGKGPFFRQVKFASDSLHPLPVASLCSRGSSDLGTSLVGLARVGLSTDPGMDARWLAQAVTRAHRALHCDAPDLLREKKVLTPPPDGTRGAATMLVGLGVALAYRLLATRQTAPSPRDNSALVSACREALDLPTNGNFSGPAKRKLLGIFCEAFFADLADAVPLHAGVPAGLLRILSPSAYGLPPMPREKKARRPAQPKMPKVPKKQNKPKKEEPAEDPHPVGGEQG